MGNFGSCLDNVNIPPCVWFAGGEKRNALASMVAGILVSDSFNFFSIPIFSDSRFGVCCI